MISGTRIRGLFPVVMATTVVLPAAGGCTANPPPPITSTESPETKTTEPAKNTVVVAIDEIGLGLNPHLLSDASPVTSAVAAMVLPSPFRPVPDPAVPGGTNWVPDAALVNSAEVTSTNPFTITYKLADQANWSDGAPIAAEDFWFLWQQMISQPGVVDPAGYRAITDVGSSGGGKTVTVTMNGQYPAWRELFANLVPEHLVKDAPGGFARALAETIPVSGGSFRIKSADRGRDEILLERNDRFWGTPARPDQILLRRGGSAAQVAESLRNGDAQAAVVHGGPPLQSQLAAISGVRTGRASQPRQLQFALNGRSAQMSDPRVRQGILNLLDQNLLATVGGQTDNWNPPSAALTRAPSDPGYHPTEPRRVPPDQAMGLLAQAGYVRQPPPPPPAGSPPPPPGAAPPAPGPLLRDGHPLTMRIGAVAEDVTALAVANTAADQLRSAGVDVTVQGLRAEDMYGKTLLDGGIEAVVGWHAVGGDQATAAASRFGCPPVLPPNPDETTRTAIAAAQRAPSNISGLCDPSAQPALEAALHGNDVGRTLDEVEPKLWNLAAVLPIVQDTAVVAVAPSVDGIGLPGGAVAVGFFADAARWRRAS